MSSRCYFSLSRDNWLDCETAGNGNGQRLLGVLRVRSAPAGRASASQAGRKGFQMGRGGRRWGGGDEDMETVKQNWQVCVYVCVCENSGCYTCTCVKTHNRVHISHACCCEACRTRSLSVTMTITLIRSWFRARHGNRRNLIRLYQLLQVRLKFENDGDGCSNFADFFSIKHFFLFFIFL